MFRALGEWWRDRLAARQPQAALARAQLLLRQGRPEAALRLLGIAAAAGLPTAACALGQCYLMGTGVPRDLAQAMHWLSVAARQEVVAAQVKLAGLLLHGVPDGDGLFAARAVTEVRDYDQAAHWARAAAHAGDAEGMALLAFILTSGPAALSNEAEAKLWFARAAAAGVPQGQLGHGLTLLEQARTAAEAGAALAEIAKAAAAGLAPAHDCLGTLLETGTALVVPDVPLAMTHYRAAAQAGRSHAMARYGLALLDGHGVTRDEIAGESWLRRAALAGEAAAALRLGKLYAAPDRALPPNYMEAVRWFQLAAEAGDAEAANAMGKLHLMGRGVLQDMGEALAWFTRAAGGSG